MAKLHDLNQTKLMQIKGKLVDLSQPKIMGILNVTPDSFYEESRTQKLSEILKRVETMIENGADIIDIGGVSTRPGAEKVDYLEEIKRIEIPLKALRKEFPEILISLDTYRANTAKIGIENGVDLINDVSGGNIDHEIIEVVAKYKAPYVLTHSFGIADSAPTEEIKENIIQELINYFSKKINVLQQKGIHDIILDPGFGFGKTLAQNFELLDNFKELKILDKPILVGVSRKSMIYNKLNTSPENSLTGTIALNSVLFHNGASIFRVHDVAEMNSIRTLLNQN